MKTKTVWRLARFTAKGPKLSPMVRHPIRRARNRLALRGARSLLKTRGAAVTAAVATAALALPFAVMAVRNSTRG